MREKRFPDIFVLIAIGVLFLLGVFVLYTTNPIGATFSSLINSLVARQILFGFVSVLCITVLISIDPQITKTLLIQIIMWSVITLLLIGLFALGPIVNATHRWYHIGSFLFQPSEFVKIATTLWVAFWLTQEKLTLWRRFIFATGGIGVFAVLVIIEPDLGSTIVILSILMSMVLAWGIKYQFSRIMVLVAGSAAGIFLVSYFTGWWLLLLLLIPVLGLGLKSNFMASVSGIGISVAIVGLIFGSVMLWHSPLRKYVPDYIQKRITTFTGETNNPNEVFQRDQAKIAVGSGQLWGKGLAQGTQSRLRFLPEYTTDFIFSAFIEERGYVGMVLLLLVYLLLFSRLFYLALQVEDEYARLVIIGLTVKLWLETFVNIGMNMGILPTKGVALPFMSYGGSSLLANSIIIGIILSLYRFESKRGTI